MLEFRLPELEDRAWLKPVLERSGHIGSEYAFGTMYIWRGAYHSKVCRVGDAVFRSYGKEALAYALPLGGDLRTNVEIMMADASERGRDFRMTGLSQAGVQALEQAMPGRFTFVSDRDAADYIYLSEDLIQLAGKKYHGKRNHISKFERLYQWTYEDLSPQNMDECMALAREWCKQYGCSKENGLDKESCALRVTFDQFGELGFIGGMLRVDGKPVAFTIGEQINGEAFVVHFEKALGDYTGAYTMINREFCRRRLGAYRYINREEDMGLEGLRKAKLSYYPAILLEKYIARPVQ